LLISLFSKLLLLKNLVKLDSQYHWWCSFHKSQTQVCNLHRADRNVGQDRKYRIGMMYQTLHSPEQKEQFIQSKFNFASNKEVFEILQIKSTVEFWYNDILGHPTKYHYNENIVISRIFILEQFCLPRK